jgi:hypothetical protein
MKVNPRGQKAYINYLNSLRLFCILKAGKYSKTTSTRLFLGDGS